MCVIGVKIENKSIEHNRLFRKIPIQQGKGKSFQLIILEQLDTHMKKNKSLFHTLQKN